MSPTSPPSRLTTALFVTLLVLCAITLALATDMGARGRLLAHPEIAPRAGASLQLAADAPAANRVLSYWARTPVPVGHDVAGPTLSAVFRAQLAADTRLIAFYAATLLVALWWGARASGAARGLAWALAVLAIVGAGADRLENRLLRDVLSGGTDSATVAMTRLLAQIKYLALLPPVLGVVAFAGAALRRRKAPKDPDERILAERFEDLVRRETAGIFAKRPHNDPDTPLVPAEPSDEPWVSFRSADVVGLALSGGGIRSATFNLGVLQQLADCGVLPLVDYVSTVSGGGYVGGFLSAWLSGDENASQATRFPAPNARGQAPRQGADASEVRHLREFAEFLVPRRGLFRVEMWRGVVAVLAGLLPALLIALSVISATLLAWLALTFAHACSRPEASVAVVAVLTTIVLVAFEAWSRLSARSGPERASGIYFATALAAVVLVSIVQWSLPAAHEWLFDYRIPIYTTVGERLEWVTAIGNSAYARWWEIAGMTVAPGHLFVSPRLLDFGVVWLGTAVVLLFVRVAHAAGLGPWSPETVSAFDRVVMRLLALAAVWAVLAALWHLCIIFGWFWRMLVPTVLSGGAFAATRHWIEQVGRTTSQQTAVSRLARYVPQILAYTTVLLATAGVGSALVRLNEADWYAWYATAALTGFILVIGLLIDPSQFGLHAFYRDRLARAYLGARHAAPRQRTTEMQQDDDVRLCELPTRPLQLVCCAANDLSGDPVETLSRGARSATLSRLGFTVGGDHVATPELTLGAAITASAAAFNSNMGSLSSRLGPVVGFLMTALNLRLGLWMRHPRSLSQDPVRRWPGLLLYREMLSLTSASGYARDPDTRRALPLNVFQRDVHLSDGGHFENLGLYELIRRHCRYIIVCDCGADPDVAFDDLGNAFRRIREDFGVDIDIDIEPLRPGTSGRSRQHVAIGSIDYSDVDRGILIYLKPSMTGDEPPDVLQYQARNTAFPHESTGDQFYDEAQWESYRRLGKHVAARVFSFVREEGAPSVMTADWVFAEARAAWHPTPAGLPEQVLAMTARFGELERDLRKSADSRLLGEVFPELEGLGGLVPDGAAPVTTPSDLGFLLRTTQIMEDVWMGCQLDLHWAHPLNLGWVNLFARWSTTRSFRLWWPLLSPMYSPGFRRFVEHRFSVSAIADHALELDCLTTEPTGLAMQWWRERSAQPRRWQQEGTAGVRWYVLGMAVPKLSGGSPPPLELGVTAVTVEGRLAGWTSLDFFVPPSLWGAGLGGAMLYTLMARLERSCDACLVCVRAPHPGADHIVARTDERGFVEQYRKHGFRQLPAGRWSEDPEVAEAVDRLRLHVGAHDTLLMRQFAGRGRRSWRPRQEG